MEQIPHPGKRLLLFCGDTVEFTLRVPHAGRGRALLRTNIGHADTARLAIIEEAVLHQKRLAEDWYDIPMREVAGETYSVRLPLTEAGHFEAKTLFLPENSYIPLWPEGDNVSINVHPAEYCCNNTIYNAFVRLFGQDHRTQPSVSEDKRRRELEERNFAVIPPSGTFRDLIRRLDFIIGRLKCRIILLLPIHPTPTVYGRMGEFGSPYAALDYMDVDPALAEFDRKATPLEQFAELLDAVHARGAKLFMDIAINHTGWAAKIHSEHPEWLLRDPDGTIHSPGAWGVTWADLTELNHKRPELWSYLADVFLTWCRRGVDGFRCDASHMIPVPAWEFIVARVRREFPDTIFLLEGLGGGIDATRAQLNFANLNWAYSELFQNYDRSQIENYLAFAWTVSAGDGLLANFAETHDNPRLAARGHVYAKMRTALAALCSNNGAFAFAGGVEWFATEKIDVHKKTSLNWDNPVNQVEHIAALNSILRSHPAFFNGAQARMIQRGEGNCLAVLRLHPPTGKKLLVLVNLDDKTAQRVTWTESDAQFRAGSLTDLLSGREIVTAQNETGVDLAPGEVLCLTPDAQDLRVLEAAGNQPLVFSEQTRRQQLRAKALAAFSAINRACDLSDLNMESLAGELAADPLAFCRWLRHNAKVKKAGGVASVEPAGIRTAHPEGSPHLPEIEKNHALEDGVTVWNWPGDVRREVMVPPHYFLLVKSGSPFRAQLKDGEKILGREEAVCLDDGTFFALFLPRHVEDFSSCSIDLSVYAAEGVKHSTGHLLYLPENIKKSARKTFLRDELPPGAVFLATNGRGGMMRAAVKWGELRSKYDALLAGNLSISHPEDRRVMLTRCRAWLVYHGYSQDVTIDRLGKFSLGSGCGRWLFRIPFGYDKMVFCRVEAVMAAGLNAVRLSFRRLPAAMHKHCLEDEESACLIIRPDIEDRSFHEDTKAYLGPEQSFPGAIRSLADGFVFAPDANRQLKAAASQGVFHLQPEWQYMVYHPVEAERGLQPASDLFSPGYFRCDLKGDEEVVISAQIITPQEKEENIISMHSNFSRHMPPEEDVLIALEHALRQFVVKRGDLKTVIAGYPWFLDWGRDTLIVCRGMIAAGMHDEVLRIVCQLASFEEQGTLPNMIIGNNAGNRDSSDAPLWLFVVCSELRRALKRDDWLNEKCGRHSLREALFSIASSYRRGTPNGIVADPESGLIFSPAHFTWMDTNFPAATPRRGYPVEIQALWFAALEFMAGMTGEKQWKDFAGLVRDSIVKLFWRGQETFFADCLHAEPGRPAAAAMADDALRPNQLLLLTLGAVDDAQIAAGVLAACGELIVPGAIRSLADRPVAYPLPVEANRRLLNNPSSPYWGRYEGDEDTRRKPAYHNGTAWTWLFPSFCEAWFKHYGRAGGKTALSILSSSLRLINCGCLGQIPEILDGDYPHQSRGCDAQAWGVSELYRVWKLLAEEG